MPSTTRRRTLQTAATLLAGFAGCAGESSSSNTSHPSEPSGNVAVDPESYSLRNPDQDPVIWTGERPTPRDDDPERHRPFGHHFFVASADDAAGVSVADVEGADGARAFLDATDYDAATVYVERVAVGECYAQDLCHVRWSETEIDTSYVRYYRDADVACDREARDVIATLIRIPEAFDPSDVNGYGSSRGSGTCEDRNERLRRRRDAANGSEDE